MSEGSSSISILQMLLEVAVQVFREKSDELGTLIRQHFTNVVGGCGTKLRNFVRTFVIS